MSDAAEPSVAVNVRPRGPYLVNAEVPVRRSSIVKSEHEESLTYHSQEPMDTGDGLTALCRCGGSANKPFCDGSHNNIEWEDAETASGSYADRSSDLGGEGLTIRDDRSICVHAGFCGNSATNVWNMAAETGDSLIRAQAISMIERCPSGALTYALTDAEDSNEQDLPVQVAIIDDGPLYVSGGVPVVSAEGETYEVRNRVTLCRCGASANKPFCDGAHSDAGFQDS